MKRKNPKYTHEFTDHDGNARYYLRAPGRKRVPLPGLPWSPEFMEARELALNSAWEMPRHAANRMIAGTVNAALVSYYMSSAFRDGLADSSQKMRRAILEHFRAEHGDKQIAGIHSTALQNILNKKTPSSSRNWKKALRGFLLHCRSLGMIKGNPLADVTLVKMKTVGHHPWEIEECEKFEAYYPVGTRARLAYALLLQAGQSKCDVIRMGRQHVRSGSMSMKRQKTGVPFYVEVTPALQEAIDAMPPSNHLTFLVTAKGNPFTAAGFGNHFRDLCNAAGLPKRCTSHGLRKAAAMYFAEKGATDHQLMAWFGWTSISQAQVYTKAANRKLMSQDAAKLISGTTIGKSLTEFAKSDANSLKNKQVKP